jgi:hypothetical protein
MLGSRCSGCGRHAAPRAPMPPCQAGACAGGDRAGGACGPRRRAPAPAPAVHAHADTQRPRRRQPQRAAAAAARGAEAGAPAGGAAAAARETPPSDPSFAPLARWLEAAGGRVSGLDLRPCRMGPATVRGLVATAPAPAGAALLSVPLSRALRDDAAPPAFPGAPWTASVAALLLDEADKGAASVWAPYIASLPGGHLLAAPGGAGASSGSGRDSSSSSGGGGGGGGGGEGDEWPAGMLLLGEAGIDEVQYAPAAAALRAYQAQARAAYDAWRTAGGRARAPGAGRGGWAAWPPAACCSCSPWALLTRSVLPSPGAHQTVSPQAPPRRRAAAGSASPSRST